MQELKYIFTADFLDGTVFVQPKEDRSAIDEKRSSFFDVLEYDKNTSRLTRFSISGDNHTFSVDLVEGHFEVDGVPFLMHEEKDNLSDFRVIFFRRHRHTLNLTATTMAETAHVVTYRIGWQCTVDGKNHQRVMEIA